MYGTKDLRNEEDNGEAPHYEERQNKQAPILSMGKVYGCMCGKDRWAGGQKEAMNCTTMLE